MGSELSAILYATNNFFWGVSPELFVLEELFWCHGQMQLSYKEGLCTVSIFLSVY